MSKQSETAPRSPDQSILALLAAMVVVMTVVASLLVRDSGGFLVGICHQAPRSGVASRHDRGRLDH
jgi:hypothetical protein